MSELLFVAPIEKIDITKPTRRGIPRVSFTRPAVADEVDPIPEPVEEEPERKTRESLTPGTVVIVLEGEHKGRRAIVTSDKGSGLVTVNGPQSINGVPAFEIDQDYLIATSQKVDIPSGASDSAIVAAVKKVELLEDYLKEIFTLKKGDLPHMMKF